MRGWRFIPLSTRRQIICRIFGSLMAQLKRGDIVWCHNWPYVAEALEPAIHSRSARLIYRAHNSIIHYSARTLFESFTLDALIFNSEAMRQEALRVMPHLKNTYAVHNGADEALFHPLPAGAARSRPVPIVLYVGRLVPQKGVHVLIEAMEILQQRNVQVLCKVVGSSHAGGSQSKMTAYIKSLYNCRPSNVRFEGFRTATDIAQEYRAADVFCCPSTWQEPFGNVNVEAMASGIPVVATCVGGIPEIAAEGGIVLVEAGSAVKLADALQKLIEDKDLRRRVAAEGLASFRRRFTWGIIHKQCNAIVNGLESGRREVQLT